MTLDDSIMPIIIGNNKILTLVTEQGYWSLFQAESLDSGDHLWFQILNEEASKDSQLTSLFFKAAAVSKAIDHQSVIHTIDYGEQDDMFYAVHAYEQGRFLEEMLEKENVLSEEQVLYLLKTISRALQTVHMSGFKHGFLRPSSIFLTDEGDLRLFNFGMGPLADYALFTKQDPIAHTFAEYMSPERLQDQGRVDSQEEIFSLGLIAFECLTGGNPRKNQNYEELVGDRGIIYSNSLPETDNISSSTRLIVQRMLKPREERYENFVELLQDLEPRPVEVFQDDEDPVHQSAFSEHFSNWFQWLLPKDPAWVGNRVRMVRIFAPLLIIVVLIALAFFINLQSGSPLDEQELLYQEFVEEIESQERQSPARTDIPLQAPVETESPEIQQEKPAPVSAPKIEQTSFLVPLTIHVSWDDSTEANVYINDKFAGLLQGTRTSISKQVEPNRSYRIRVESKDYETAYQSITAGLQSSNELYIDLNPLAKPAIPVNFAKVSFAEQISINGHLQRTKLPVQIELTEGMYPVTYYEPKAGFQWTTNVRIHESMASQIQFDPSALGNGTLSVVLKNALQYGYAYVTLDDKNESRSTPVRFTLPAGWHRIQIERKGFNVIPSDTLVFVKPNERLVIDCHITPR
jgi:serine/threonine protein kinase